MALKQLMLTRRIAEKRKLLEEARSKDAGFSSRKKKLQKRETDLEAALKELPEDAPLEDEVAAIEESVVELEKAQEEFEAELEDQAETISRLEAELDALEEELEDLNRSATPSATVRTRQNDEKRGEHTMSRMKFFRGMPSAERDALMARADVKDFLARVRGIMAEKRAGGVNGAELLIPDVFLGLLRDQLDTYSKLASVVNLRRVPGTSRQTIAGTIPEGVWTEMCATLNELSISFNQVELDGYKVGGFVPVCNALLEDSDIILADEVLWNILQAIGYALDKAIVYGTGTKMPLGIMTRLAQAAKPSNWGTNAPAWTDLRATNLLKVDGALADVKFYQALILALGIPRANYSNGDLFWAMSRKTHAQLQAKALVFNAAGAIVSGQNMTMPVVGGDIILLDFIPKNDIVGGYGDLYVLAERAGAQLAQSEHARFVEDQTVFRGTARYDGLPVFGESFVGVNIANAAPTTTMAFAPDKANEAKQTEEE